MEETLLVAASLACSMAAMAILTPLVIRLARRMDWLAYPKQDRWHSRPTALMGGIAIYASATIAVVLFAPSTEIWLIWGGASVMFVTGLIDDLKSIRPVTKLLAQVLAAGILIYAGYLFGPNWPIWLSVPITFLWIIGITNAVNLLDNMDGLAAGIAAIAAGTLGFFSLASGDPASARAALALAGAAAGFLIYNFNPAKVFMGDCGSLFLGYVIAAMSMKIQAEVVNPEGFGVYMVSLAVLAVPIFDTTLVTVMRTARGRAVSQGGRDHSSHRLVFIGLTERRAVVTLYVVSLLFGQLALLFLFSDTRLFYVVAVYMMIGMIIFGVYLARMNVYKEEASVPERRERRLFAFLHMFAGRNWKLLFGALADLILVVCAFVLAYELRFEEGMTARREAFVASALPFVVAAKLTTFFVFGLYKAIWRHAGTPELVRILNAVSVASVLTFIVLGLVFGFDKLSKGVFVIDWMIVVLSITGLRLGFRGIRQYFASRRSNGRRVLLYGAGTAGQLTVRELRQNGSLGMVPVGFIDDDPLKQGLTVQGLPVLGSFLALDRICRDENIHQVVITASEIPQVRKENVAEACSRMNIPCSVFRIGFDSVHVESVASEDASVAPPVELADV